MKDASGANGPVTALQALLDEAFGDSFTIVLGNGEASLRVALTHFVAPDAGPVMNKQSMKVAVLGA